MNVLIVDDSAFMRKLLSKILAQSGYNVVGEAENGVEAVKKYEELHPDLVTMDIVMPEVDGLKATEVILKRDKNAKIVMCTSVGQEEKMKRAIEAGAVGYITKPFQAQSVIRELKGVMG